ncbi:MAG: hypothetical protein DME19_12860 [Verrucomicrobia bacterium]|nr:MAG: hypothetical protein DME19_12860 [Verrucomicrobiota bacterium]
MAWRIDENVIRGEIDNREKGVIRGRVWLDGVAEPVALELKGNACPDLAGCVLKFDNPGATVRLPKDAHFHPLQRGTAGDMTASRKVRVFDLPFEEAYAMIKRGGKPPEHMANSLYLEWFSEFNGRVVIESADYRVEISAPAWRLTPEEDAQRARDAAAGFSGFMRKLNDALESQKHQPPEDREWDEFDYEQLMKESDARADKYLELLEKHGEGAEAERLIEKEMGWDDAQEPEQDETAAEDDRLDVDEINRITAEAAEQPLEPEPHTEGVDWIRTNDGDIRHPLQHRCFESAMKLWHACDDLGLSKAEDDDLGQLVSEFQITSAKLAGALNGLAYGREGREAAFVVACLKRALDHLHKSQAGLEKVAPRNLLPPDLVAESRKDLFEIRQEILRLMDAFRGRK